MVLLAKQILDKDEEAIGFVEAHRGSIYGTRALESGEQSVIGLQNCEQARMLETVSKHYFGLSTYKKGVFEHIGKCFDVELSYTQERIIRQNNNIIAILGLSAQMTMKGHDELIADVLKYKHCRVSEEEVLEAMSETTPEA